MSFIKDIMLTEKIHTLDVYAKTQAFTNGVLGDITWTKQKSCKCILWPYGQSDKILSERLQVDIVAIIGIDPADLTLSDIPETGKLVVNGKDYSIVTAIDVAEQDELILIYVKAFT